MSRPGRRRYGRSIRDFYHYVDGYLGEILDALDDDTVLLLMSDHGFGPFHKFIHVNNWLIREQFMQVGGSVRARIKKRLFGAGFAPMNVYNTLMQFGFGALKRKVVRGQGQGLLKTLFLSFADVDWSRTVAYSLGNVGQICINVQGREPQGCVPTGKPYEEVRDQIIDRLWQLRDPETDEQVVEAVYRREEIYHGDQLEHAPDIVFMPRRLEYFGFGEYEFGSNQVIEPMQRGISGTHRMNGIFMAYGAGIRPGAVVANSSLVDLAPTILHMLGVDVPGHVDGRILHEIFTDSFRPASPSKNGTSWQPAASQPHRLTDDEVEIIAKRRRIDVGEIRRQQNPRLERFESHRAAAAQFLERLAQQALLAPLRQFAEPACELAPEYFEQARDPDRLVARLGLTGIGAHRDDLLRRAATGSGSNANANTACSNACEAAVESAKEMTRFGFEPDSETLVTRVVLARRTIVGRRRQGAGRMLRMRTID